MQSPMMPADWSQLSSDVLEHLTGFLSPLDHYRFGAVCRNWRSVVKQKRDPPRPMPWLVFGEDASTHKRTFYSLDENKHYSIDVPELRGQRLCGSSFGWVFTLDIRLNFRLLDPSTKKRYDLPPLPCYNKDITSYVQVQQSEDEFTYEYMQFHLVSKAILDRDPNNCGGEFTVLMLYGSPRKLASWKLGDAAWTLIRAPTNSLDDIIFFNKKFYVVGTLGRYNEIYLIDVRSDPTVTRVGPRVRAKTFAHLVDYMGELLLVQRRRKFVREWLLITRSIKVKKIDLEEEKYSDFEPEDDGHNSVFLGANSCMTLDTRKYPGCKKNSLYLTDLPMYLETKYGCKDLWIYDMVEGSFSRYYDRIKYIPDFDSPIWLNPSYGEK